MQLVDECEGCLRLKRNERVCANVVTSSMKSRNSAQHSTPVGPAPTMANVRAAIRCSSVKVGRLARSKQLPIAFREKHTKPSVDGRGGRGGCDSDLSGLPGSEKPTNGEAYRKRGEGGRPQV